MKKLFSMLAMAVALIATSCSQDDFDVAGGNEATVTFSVQLPQDIATRAYSDGQTATNLYYAVYAKGSKTVLITNKKEGGEVVTFDNKVATVNLALANGMSYDMIFWAVSPNNETYNVDFAAQTMTVDYTKMFANDEDNDAFYSFETFTVHGAHAGDVKLYRPFAQINLGTNDYAGAATAGLTVLNSEMTITHIANVLNFADGSVEYENNGEKEYYFQRAAVPAHEGDNKETFPKEGYEYLEMNYVLVGKDQQLVDCIFVATDTNNNGMEPIVVKNIPVQRNHRTNIYGSLLTEPANFTVTIMPDWTEPDEEVPADVAALHNAAKNGGHIALEADMTLEEHLTVEKDLTINLNGKTLGYELEDDKAHDKYAVVKVANGATLTIEGDGAIEATPYVFMVENGTLNIKGGEFKAYLTAVQVTKGVANISGGTFDMIPGYANGTQYLLNCIDANYNNGSAAINVTGGTFVGFNPAKNTAEGADTNFVAEGYESQLVEGTTNTYEVVLKKQGATAKVATAAELAAVLTRFAQQGASGNVVEITEDFVLAENENWTPVYFQAQDITINGNGHTISNLNGALFGSALGGAFVVNDLTIADSTMPVEKQSGHGANGIFMGFSDAIGSLTLTNCHAVRCKVYATEVNGECGYAGLVGYHSTANGAVITNCTVTDCEFTGYGIGGILGHGGGAGTTIENCEVNNCKFFNVEGRWDKTGYIIGTYNTGECVHTNNKGAGNYAYPSSEAKNGVALDRAIGRFAPANGCTLNLDGTTYTEAFSDGKDFPTV